MAGTPIVSPIIIRGLLNAYALVAVRLDYDPQHRAVLLTVVRNVTQQAIYSLPIGRLITRDEILKLLTGSVTAKSGPWTSDQGPCVDPRQFSPPVLMGPAAHESPP